MEQLLFGIMTIAILIGIAVLVSESRRNIQWVTVFRGIGVQILLIYFVLETTIGQKILDVTAKGITKVLSFGNDGLAFVFGDFSTNFFSFAINVLAMICFTSALIGLLYYLKVIPFLVKWIGGAIARFMGTTPAETFSAVGSSVFSGTESPLLIKPYLSRLTRSELFAVSLGGFASASVNVLAGYHLLGIPMEYLLIATATVPFATLVMAKIIIPETQTSVLKHVEVAGSEDSNVFEAIGNGGIQGMQIALSVGAVLIAFLGTVALIDYGLGFIGTNTTELLGFVFRPLAWLFQIPASEVNTFGSLIGIKTATNEYVAYTSMSGMIDTLSPRTLAILSVALCNFANFSVIGIQQGFFKAVVPERAKEVSGFGLKALLGGLLTTLITACIVGLFF